MYLVLLPILKYLNGEDLLNAELTSKVWKAAIWSVNLSTFWRIQFQKKVTIFSSFVGAYLYVLLYSLKILLFGITFILIWRPVMI